MAVTLDSIVKEYIIESGGATEHNYARLLQLAIKGLREIHIDVSGDPKAVYLTVSDNDTVNLPDDYINYLKIAVCDSETGNVHSLGWNKQMCLPRSYDDCGNISRPENNVNQQGVSDKIYLEYLAHPEVAGGQHHVHEYALEAVQAFMHWRNIRYNRTYNQNDKMAAKKDFLDEKDKTRRRFQSFTIDEAVQTIRKSYKQSPKF